MFCRRCGTQLGEGSAFCPHCGAQVAPAPQQAAVVVQQPLVTEEVSPKSRLAVTLLAAFVGGFGAHRFYIGKIVMAVVMLILGLVPIVCLVLAGAAVALYSEQEDAPALFIVSSALMCVFGVAIGIWSLVDFIIAVTGSFKDSQGRPIKKW